MKLCHLGLKRDQHDQWIKCGEMFYDHSDGSCWINFTAMRIGLLQGKGFDIKTDSAKTCPAYVQGDLYVGDQWIGFVNSSDTKTGAWYTATILLIPMARPSETGLIRAEVR